MTPTDISPLPESCEPCDGQGVVDCDDPWCADDSHLCDRCFGTGRDKTAVEGSVDPCEWEARYRKLRDGLVEQFGTDDPEEIARAFDAAQRKLEAQADGLG